MSPTAKRAKAFDRKRLAKLTEDSGKTLVDVAAGLGYSVKQLLVWINGDADPRAETLVDIAKYFMVSTDYLLGLSDEPKPSSYLSADDRKLLIAAHDRDIMTILTMIMGNLSNQVSDKKKKRRGK